MDVIQVLDASKRIQDTINNMTGPTACTSGVSPQEIIPMPVVQGSRGYIENVVRQINGSFSFGWYDCCAVMIRKLLEILIIETFESKQLSEEIKDPINKDYLMLGDLISRLLSHQEWGLGRQTKRDLPHLKDIGNMSAHARRYCAKRQDIEPLRQSVRNITEELLFLSELKK